LKGVQKNLDSGSFFDVCTCDRLHGVLDSVEYAELSQLKTIHCVYYKDMPSGFKSDIIEEINRIFGNALSEFGIVFENRISSPL
jgi:hypothetical protein